MTTCAPAIQGPSDELIAELMTSITTEPPHCGPVFCWDKERQVFLMAVIDQGIVKHWQIEPARDQAEANAARMRCLQAVLTSMHMLKDRLPTEQRAELDRALADVRGRRVDH